MTLLKTAEDHRRNIKLQIHLLILTVISGSHAFRQLYLLPSDLSVSAALRHQHILVREIKTREVNN